MLKTGLNFLAITNDQTGQIMMVGHLQSVGVRRGQTVDAFRI